MGLLWESIWCCLVLHCTRKKMLWNWLFKWPAVMPVSFTCGSVSEHMHVAWPTCHAELQVVIHSQGFCVNCCGWGHTSHSPWLRAAQPGLSPDAVGPVSLCCTPTAGRWVALEQEEVRESVLWTLEKQRGISLCRLSLTVSQSLCYFSVCVIFAGEIKDPAALCS